MLAGNTGYHFQLLNSVIEVNELQKRRVISKLSKHLGSLVGKRVALLGLAFKPNTDDMREASSLVLAARLQGEGASVVAYDPVAEGPAGRDAARASTCATRQRTALEGADAAILVTEWPEFAELDWEELAGRMSNPLIVDGRNFLDPARMRAAGYTYEGIGRVWLMQAVVLVGGEGTRLRPLTLTQPKPALALVDRPFIRYMVDWLGRHGIDEVIMACGFKAESLREALGDEVPGGPAIKLHPGGRAARHRGPGPACRRPGSARRSLHGSQRRRAHRPRPDRAPAPTRGDWCGDHARAASGRRPDLLRARAPRRRRRPCSASSRSPTRPRSTPTRSAPAPT